MLRRCKCLLGFHDYETVIGVTIYFKYSSRKEIPVSICKHCRHIPDSQLFLARQIFKNAKNIVGKDNIKTCSEEIRRCG